MALRTLIATHECIEEYERAAREHQDAGLILLAENSAQGVAFMALSAEMVLKAAYFRFIGYRSTQQIARVDLRAAEADIRVLGVTDSPESYHNLLFWANAVIAARRFGVPLRTHGARPALPAVGAYPMNSQDEADLRSMVMRLRANWTIGDRYKAIQPHAAKQDMDDVFDDAAMIVQPYDKGRI